MLARRGDDEVRLDGGDETSPPNADEEPNTADDIAATEQSEWFPALQDPVDSTFLAPETDDESGDLQVDTVDDGEEVDTELLGVLIGSDPNPIEDTKTDVAPQTETLDFNSFVSFGFLKFSLKSFWRNLFWVSRFNTSSYTDSLSLVLTVTGLFVAVHYLVKDGPEKWLTFAASCLLSGMALFLVGRAVRYLLPRPADPEVEILRELGVKGDVQVQRQLAAHYENEDPAEAVKWHRIAANQDVAEAQYKLAFMYELGRGIKTDYRKAAKWYRRAAKQANEWTDRYDAEVRSSACSRQAVRGGQGR